MARETVAAGFLRAGDKVLTGGEWHTIMGVPDVQRERVSFLTDDGSMVTAQPGNLFDRLTDEDYKNTPTRVEVGAQIVRGPAPTQFVQCGSRVLYRVAGEDPLAPWHLLRDYSHSLFASDCIAALAEDAPKVVAQPLYDWNRTGNLRWGVVIAEGRHKNLVLRSFNPPVGGAVENSPEDPRRQAAEFCLELWKLLGI